jgi:hypothetical protein
MILELALLTGAGAGLWALLRHGDEDSETPTQRQIQRQVSQRQTTLERQAGNLRSRTDALARIDRSLNQHIRSNQSYLQRLPAYRQAEYLRQFDQAATAAKQRAVGSPYATGADAEFAAVAARLRAETAPQRF